MQGWSPGRTVLLVVCLLILFFQPVTGFSVTRLSIDPSGALTPGTMVVASFNVGFNADSVETFPSGSDLILKTDLENPKWSYSLILDGVEKPRKPIEGQMLDLSGFELSYPAKVNESMRITLEGTVPVVDTTTNKTIIRFIEQDDSCMNCPAIQFTALVVNMKDAPCCIEPIDVTLRKFRSHIDEDAQQGINTTATEEKFAEAQRNIDSARAHPATQYAEVLNDLNAAHTTISEGERLLDKAWAEKEVADAQIPITDVDNVIAGIKSNGINPPPLAEIFSKRELAMNYLVTANDQIAAGNYSAARERAGIALALGNESYTSALEYQLEHESVKSQPMYRMSLSFRYARVLP